MKLKNTLKAVGSVLAGALVVVEIILIALVLVSRVSGQTPAVFGYQLFQIITPSMEPEIMVDDIIISKAYTGGEVQVGDVVTYIGREGEYRGKRITHEVIAADGNTLITKGVANPSADPAIQTSDIIGVMVYKTVILGKIYKVISSTAGFIFLLVLPLVIMIISECRDLIRQIRKEAQSGDEDNE